MATSNSAKKIPKKTVVSWQKKIREHQLAVGKERDKIRDTISELKELEEVCSRAYDDLQSAVDTLSELV